MHWVGGVGVLASLDSFENAQSVVLCILCFCGDFGVVVLPYRHHLEKGGRCAQRVDGLPIDAS